MIEILYEGGTWDRVNPPNELFMEQLNDAIEAGEHWVWLEVGDDEYMTVHLDKVLRVRS